VTTSFGKKLVIDNLHFNKFKLIVDDKNLNTIIATLFRHNTIDLYEILPYLIEKYPNNILPCDTFKIEIFEHPQLFTMLKFDDQMFLIKKFNKYGLLNIFKTKEDFSILKEINLKKILGILRYCDEDNFVKISLLFGICKSIAKKNSIGKLLNISSFYPLEFSYFEFAGVVKSVITFGKLGITIDTKNNDKSLFIKKGMSLIFVKEDEVPNINLMKFKIKKILSVRDEEIPVITDCGVIVDNNNINTILFSNYKAMDDIQMINDNINVGCQAFIMTMDF
jgi:hypothetical protein